MPNSAHPLLDLFLDAARERFPAADGGVTVLPDLPGGLACSVAFTGHAVVATALSTVEVLGHRPDGFGGAMAPEFLRALAGPTGSIGTIDATLVRLGTGGAPRLPPLANADGHPRVRYARGLRTDVRVFGDDRGLVTVAAGLAGRTELSIELHHPDGGSRGGGDRSSPTRSRWFPGTSPCSPRSHRATRGPCARSSPPDSPRSAPR